MAKDDGPRASSTLEKLSELPEAFEGGGGAPPATLPAQRRRRGGPDDVGHDGPELGLQPRARIVTAATYGNEPEYMGVAPIGAIKKVLDRAGMTIEQRRRRRAQRGLRRPGDPHHGRVQDPAREAEHARRCDRAGHPFGMTGARIMTTLLNVMESDDHEVGLETMCVAGGQGKAMIVERLN